MKSHHRHNKIDDDLEQVNIHKPKSLLLFMEILAIEDI